MTSTTAGSMPATTSRLPLIATIAVAASAVITAVGTFWDVTDNESGEGGSVGEYLAVVGIIVVASAIVFGLVARTADRGNPGRRALVLGVLAAASIVVFWAGLPTVLAAGAVACALTQRDQSHAFSGPSVSAIALAGLATVAAVVFAVIG
jgi:hypothetical protein